MNINSTIFTYGKSKHTSMENILPLEKRTLVRESKQRFWGKDTRMVHKLGYYYAIYSLSFRVNCL